jgi:hypothetical protein
MKNVVGVAMEAFNLELNPLRILISNVHGVIVIKFCVISEGNERGAGPNVGTALFEGDPAGVDQVRAADVKDTRFSHGRRIKLRNGQCVL